MTLLLLDTETDSPNPLEARIVTLDLVAMNDDGGITQQKTWIFDTGREMPEGAAAVHGIDTATMQAKGLKGDEAKQAFRDILSIIEAETANGAPLVAYNAPFDTTVLEMERRRLVPDAFPLYYWDGNEGICVYDPFVAWKWLEKYLRGSRKLMVAAAHYGIQVDESRLHQSDYDCYLAGRVALNQLQHDRMRGIPFDVIHEGLQLAHADQAASLQAYFAKSGKTNDDGTPIVCDPGWPLHTALTTTATKEEA